MKQFIIENRNMTEKIYIDLFNDASYHMYRACDPDGGEWNCFYGGFKSAVEDCKEIVAVFSDKEIRCDEYVAAEDLRSINYMMDRHPMLVHPHRVYIINGKEMSCDKTEDIIERYYILIGEMEKLIVHRGAFFAPRVGIAGGFHETMFVSSRDEWEQKKQELINSCSEYAVRIMKENGYIYLYQIDSYGNLDSAWFTTQSIAGEDGAQLPW